MLFSGTVYTARDAAHKKLVAMIDNGEPLPFDLQNATVYYAGPTPAPEGMVIWFLRSYHLRSDGPLFSPSCWTWA